MKNVATVNQFNKGLAKVTMQMMKKFTTESPLRWQDQSVEAIVEFDNQQNENAEKIEVVLDPKLPFGRSRVL